MEILNLIPYFIITIFCHSLIKNKDLIIEKTIFFIKTEPLKSLSILGITCLTSIIKYFIDNQEVSINVPVWGVGGGIVYFAYLIIDID